MLSNHLILCRPLLRLPSVIPGNRVFPSESALHIRWPKYWSFTFRISPSSEYLGLISFRIDWFDLLQSKRLSRVFSSPTIQKHPFLSTFIMVHLSHPCMTTGKTVALTVWIFIGQVMSLLFYLFSRFVIAFLPRSQVF